MLKGTQTTVIIACWVALEFYVAYIEWSLINAIYILGRVCLVLVGAH